MNHIDKDPMLTSVIDTETSEPEVLTYEEMYGKYRAKLVGITMSAYRQNEADAEDIVQDTFRKAYEHFDEYKDMGYTHLTWLSKILKRTMLDKVRRASYRPEDLVSDMYSYVDAPDPHANDDFNNIELDEILNNVARVLEPKLGSPTGSSDWYDIFTMRLLDDFTVDEISKRLEIPSGTVKSGFSRARQRLVEFKDKDPELHSALGIQ